MSGWTNQTAIERRSVMPREVLAEMAADGDFCKRHLMNPVLLRMLGDVTGRLILDAGCGNGYLSRMLARAGAQVTGVEPAAALFEFAAANERAQPLGCRIAEVTEPGLDPAVAATDPDRYGGEHPYVHLPNFLIVAADAPAS